MTEGVQNWTDLCNEELSKIDKKYLNEVYQILRYYRRLPAVENSNVVIEESEAE